MVWNDPEVLKRLERFVPAVGDGQRYRGVTSNVLEYQLVRGAMMQTPFAESMERWHVQGIYVITPSGKLIAGSNPKEASATIRELDKGLEKYAAMPKAERLLPRAPDPARDRVKTEADDSRPPADGLVLRMVSRGLPNDAVSRDDTRHEFFYKLDRVYYTKEEARAFVPSTIAVGAKEAVKRPVYNRLVRLHLGVFVQPNLYWQPEDVKEATLQSEIVGVKAGSVEVKLTGRARMDSATNGRGFDADLLGKAKFDARTGKFTSFELLAVGTHQMGPNEPAPRLSPMGVLFTLNGTNPNDQVPPLYQALYLWASGN